MLISLIHLCVCVQLGLDYSLVYQNSCARKGEESELGRDVLNAYDMFSLHVKQA